MEACQIQQLRDLPIEEVAGRLGLHVDRHHRCICPYHADTHPSLHFHPRRATFRCFVCGASGDVIDLAMRQLGVGFLQACRWLAQEQGMVLAEARKRPPPKPAPAFQAARYEPFFRHPCLSPEARRFLFDERAINARVAAWCRLGSWRDARGNPWLQIPYYDADGRLVGVQNRNLTPGATPRFRFPAGSRCGIYNLPVIRRLRPPADELYITEGCSDCWAMLSAGHKAIAIPSATLLSQADRRLLTDLAQRAGTAITFHMYPDQDAPGEQLFLQLQSILPDIVRHQLPPGCKDFADFYLQECRKAA